ncbi:MAG: dihydropteroate synthase, partial [Nitrospinae bacterium]|nr:dihydropteroate synthase [Nitrospinota bacterium]
MEPFSFPQNKTLVMGIINLSHDSFYEKSRYKTVEQAIRAAESMLEEGADILDIGAESSRPGSVPISPQEESKRLLPVLSQLVKVANVPISVDTYKPVVAQQVLQEGASIINDIT